MQKNTAKQSALSITIVAPVGKFIIKDMNTPKTTQDTDTADETRIVLLKPLDTCRAVTVGNIIRLEISMVPTTRMPSTIVIEVSTEIK